MDEEPQLIEFYGAECPPCKQVMMHIKKLEREEGIKIERLEVWHNSGNANLMMKYAHGRCNGVPFLYDKKNDTFLCGDVSYEQIRDWAKKS